MDREKEDILGGIKLWLKARQVEAVRANNRGIYEAIEVLLADIESSAAGNEYPWELLMRGFIDKMEGKV